VWQRTDDWIVSRSRPPDTLPVLLITGCCCADGELRTRIDALRVRYALTGFPYLDTAMGAGVTIKAQHILDLRAALTAVYVAAGLPVPYVYRSGLPAGTMMKVAHIAELRAAVIAIE